ncbi:MAG: Lon protease family protein [Alkalispirochaetaceae bacterium]
MSNELTVADARRVVDPKQLPFQGTAEVEPSEEIIGQDRAIRALEFGLQVSGEGFNVYVSGPPGIGKKTSVKEFVEQLASQKPTPSDWCFVHNHREPYEPRAIRLDPGKGRDFSDDIDELKEFIQRDIPGLFESDEYSSKREETLREVQEKGQNAQAEIREKAQEKGFVLQQTFVGTALVPVKNGEPLRDEDLQNLPQEEQEQIEQRRQELQDEVKDIQKRYRRLDREAKDKVKELDRDAVRSRLEGPLEDLREKYEGHDAVLAYLDDVEEDVLDNIDTLKSDPEQQGQQVPPQVRQQIEALKQQFFKKYQVNVVVDNSRREGAPVVTELNPTYNNLVGRIEKEMQMGALNTDFTLIKPGALLQANGGFLVLTVEDVLRNPYSWEGLKRALKSNELRIEEVQEQLGLMSIKTLRPQPIPLDLKVVLIGRPIIYQLLHQLDPDMQELFKVKADFDVEMESNAGNSRSFMSFLASIVEREKLPPLNGEAAAAMMEHAHRVAEHKEKISTRFGELSDVLREAGFWATQEGAKEITGNHVRRALEEKIYRSSMIKEKIVDLINRGTLLIDTDQQVVGQVNGLSVMMLGDFTFGRPNRITATVAAGRDGVVDIERESKLGGPIHNKGVLILSGFLSKQFARHSALSMSARLVFEQSYSGVEGDSASSAELYALLSVLSETPVRQGIAVTGSVNQNGDIQAIGGVNEKIEGFFDVCSVKGLDGIQGVAIPASNVQNLMLRQDVAEAIEDGKFHLWSVSRVEEGIELLTGVSAGSRDESGAFPKESIFGRVERKLTDFQAVLRSFGVNGENQSS